MKKIKNITIRIHHNSLGLFDELGIKIELIEENLIIENIY